MIMKNPYSVNWSLASIIAASSGVTSNIHYLIRNNLNYVVLFTAIMLISVIVMQISHIKKAIKWEIENATDK